MNDNSEHARECARTVARHLRKAEPKLPDVKQRSAWQREINKERIQFFALPHDAATAELARLAYNLIDRLSSVWSQFSSVPIPDERKVSRCQDAEHLRLQFASGEIEWLQSVSSYCRPGSDVHTFFVTFDEYDRLLRLANITQQVLGKLTETKAMWGSDAFTRPA